MASEQFGVYLVKDSDPEEFVIVTFPNEETRKRFGHFMNTSEPISEAHLRAALERGGVPPSEITATIARARQNPG